MTKCYQSCPDSGHCWNYHPGFECPFDEGIPEPKPNTCQYCHHIMLQEKCPIGCTKENHYNG